MKARFFFGTIALLLAALMNTGCAPESPSSEGREVRYVIGISPFLDDAVKDEVYRRVVGFLLEDMPLHSSLWLYDAYHVRTITQIDVPGVRAFRGGKTRANQFKKQIQKLKAFLATPCERPEAAPLDFDQAVRFPQFMDFVGENLTGAEHSTVVVVIGGPLYLDDKEPGFSMIDGYFPSDGHLMASREQSVFGLENRAGALKHLAVHYAYSGNPWMSEVHQEKIDRFWTLYLDQQGARLATFCGDLPTVFNALRSGTSASETRHERYEINPEQSKIEMLRLTRDVGVADWITRDVSAEAHHDPPSTTVGPMKIGIRWQGDIDLDFYARPARESETLFFEHTRSPEGYYFKDHRSSPEREYEFIEFESPVDVWQAEAWINFYEGAAPGGPKGEIRVEFEGRIYVGRFSLEADHGNQGRVGNGQGSFWTPIDIPEILNLRGGRSTP